MSCKQLNGKCKINGFGFFLTLFVVQSLSFGSSNLVSNGSFELIEGDKITSWQTIGDDTIVQQLSVDKGVLEGNSARLTCTSFERKTRLGYSTLVQKKKMNFEQGKWYKFSCWARQDGMAHAMVTAELQLPPQKGNYWKSSLLFYQIPLTRNWQKYERYFIASYIGDQNADLLFYFDFTGTLWLDDIQITEVPEPVINFTDAIKDSDSKNLIPNAGFECGTYNWLSLGKKTGWTGGLSGLYGNLDSINA